MLLSGSQDPGPDPGNPFVNVTRQDALLRDTLSPKFAAELRSDLPSFAAPPPLPHGKQQLPVRVPVGHDLCSVRAISCS